MFKRICALALISVSACFLFTSCSGGVSSRSEVLLVTLTSSKKYQSDIVDEGMYTTIDETRKGETRTLRFRGRTYTGVYTERSIARIGSTIYDTYTVAGDESVIRFGLYRRKFGACKRNSFIEAASGRRGGRGRFPVSERGVCRRV